MTVAEVKKAVGDDLDGELIVAALRHFRPALQAAFALALKNLKAGEVPLPTLLERKHFFGVGEAGVLSDVLFRIGVAAELIGRLQATRDAPVTVNLAAWEKIPLETAVEGMSVKEVLNTPPALALEYFKRLGGGDLPDDWLDGWRRKSFDLAVTTDEKVLDAVHSKILESIGTGRRWSSELELELEDLGVTSDNPQYAEMVFRTNVMDAFTSGRWHGVVDNPLVADSFPWWEYTNPDDARTGDDHRENLDGGVGEDAQGPGPYYPQDMAFEDVRGERVFNCRCRPRWIHRVECKELGLPIEEGPAEITPPVEESS